MSFPSYLPRDYRTHCHLFADEKLDEQYDRHSAAAADGCPTGKACLVEVVRELARREAGKRRPAYEELKQRRAERRAKSMKA